MIKTLLAATAAITMISGIALADDVATRESTSIGPLKFERDHTVRHDADDHMGVANRDHVQIEKEKTVTHDGYGDTTSRTHSDTTTIR
jgi:hypothetical protein